MTYSTPAPPATRRIPRLLATGLLIVTTATTAAFGYPLLASSIAKAESPVDVLRREHRGVALATGLDSLTVGTLRDRGRALLRGLDRFRQPPDRPHRADAPGRPPRAVEAGSPGAEAPGRPGAADRGQSSRPDAPGRPPDPEASGQPSRAAAPGRPGAAASADAPPPAGPRRGAPAVAAGAVPDGTTAFDDEIPGVANLDPALLGALRRAATDAADDGVTFVVTSGWRSPELQHQLRREAVSEYGSEKEAARWVATADTSPHVSGDAVDIGPSEAAAWLSRHGAAYGLCRIYGNEPWHYELRPEATAGGCPPTYPDPTHDPRMQP